MEVPGRGMVEAGLVSGALMASDVAGRVDWIDLPRDSTLGLGARREALRFTAVEAPFRVLSSFVIMRWLKISSSSMHIA